jgi:hypothetical protein
MTSEELDQKVRERLGNSLGTAPAGDFEAWHARYPDASQHLNPVLVRKRRSRRRLAVRLCKVAGIAACLFVGLWWLALGAKQNHAFGDVLQGITNAKSMTWKLTYYERTTSADGKRTWLTSATRELAYMEPGMYRETALDESGKVAWVHITDAVGRKQLQLDPQKRVATLAMLAAGEGDPRGPFASLMDEIKKHSLELVRRQQTNGGDANIFRIRFYNDYMKKPVSYDFWIDAKSKQLVKIWSPGADLFDLEKETDRLNRPEEQWSSRDSPAAVYHDIVYNAKLDRTLFSLEPPAGFSGNTIQRPTVTELEMVEFLGALARFNDGKFPDDYRGMGGMTVEFNKASRKEAKDQTEAERTLIGLHDKYLTAGLFKLPVGHFIYDQAVDGSFQYLGKGASVGEAGRLVCWYKVKSTGKYRAVYADLAVKDVIPDDLPLRVSP